MEVSACTEPLHLAAKCSQGRDQRGSQVCSVGASEENKGRSEHVERGEGRKAAAEKCEGRKEWDEGDHRL